MKKQWAFLSALLAVLGLLAGCPGGVSGGQDQLSLEGRWVFDGGGLTLTYWFYPDGTVHRESTISQPGAGYYSTSGTTLFLQFIGSAAESYEYTLTDGVLTMTDPGLGTLPFLKQATLARPVNGAPTASINGGDVDLASGARAWFSVTASDPDLQALTYLWYVDSSGQTGATLGSFTYDVPASGTHAVKVAVSDGYDVVSSTVMVTVKASSGFEQWNGSAWASLGITAPPGTLDSFTYYGNLAVRLSSNELWAWSGSAWSQLGFSAPAGTIQATCFDFYNDSMVLAGMRDAATNVTLYNGITSSWSDLTNPNGITLPVDTRDFFLAGSGIFAVFADGTMKSSPYTAPAWTSFGSTLQGTIRSTGMGYTGAASFAILAVTDDSKIYTNNTGTPDTWADSGAVVPAGAAEVLLYQNKLTVRK